MYGECAKCEKKGVIHPFTNPHLRIEKICLCKECLGRSREGPEGLGKLLLRG